MHQILISFYDSALLRISGIVIRQFVGGNWYISAMLIGGVIVYSLQRKFKEFFSFIIAPIGALLTLGYLFVHYTKLNIINSDTIVIAPGLLRALAEMSIGCVIFRIVNWLKKKHLTLLSSICLSLINITCIIIVFNGATTVLHKRFDYIMLALLAISVTIMFSEQSLYFRCRKDIIDKLMIFLGRLSLPMYLTHLWIRTIVESCTKGWSRLEGMILYCACVLSFSAFCLLLSYWWKKINSKTGHKIKRLFVME